MLSFPTTMNTGGSNLNLPSHSSSVKDVLSKSFTNAFNASVSRMTTNQGLDTSGIKYDAQRDFDVLVDSFDFTSDSALKEGPKTNMQMNANMSLPDEFKFEKSVQLSVNNYRRAYNDLEIDTGIDIPNSDQSMYTKTIMRIKNVAPSLFNPMYGLNALGISRNVPLMDGVNDSSVLQGQDVQDCSIARLVELSSEGSWSNPLGLARYKYADFMYCKNLGKVSNNHLITLRKFSIPVGDNIFTAPSIRSGDYWKSNMSMMADIGRMVTWFGTDDNKLEDIMSYEYDATFVQKEGKIQQLDSQEDDESRGIAGKILNTLSAGYNTQTARGTASGGILPDLLSHFGINLGGGPTYASNDVALGRNYDNNKVYEPKDTVRDTYLYEGKLEFRHEFTLNFSYKLRAYDNINPKAAMLDLIGNILTTTYRRGKFWGGKQQILGPQPNQEGWAKYNKFVDRSMKKVGEVGSTVLDLLFNCNEETFGAVFGQLSDVFNSAVDAAKNIASQAIGAIQDGSAPSKIENFVKKYGLGAAMTGLLKNKLGRPSLYAFDSILTGSNVGLWHVTIGNPLNPIAVFGNLIMTNCKITHTGPLGLDDFPTELKVAVTLKHGRGRDMVDISKMYTRGEQSIMLALTSRQGQATVSNKWNGGTRGKYVNEGHVPVINNKFNKNVSFIGNVDDWIQNAIENE